MITFDAPVEQACGARSGGSATDGFRTDKSPFKAVKDTPTERVDMLARRAREYWASQEAKEVGQASGVSISSCGGQSTREPAAFMKASI
jgi:hypothetical protein